MARHRPATRTTGDGDDRDGRTDRGDGRDRDGRDDRTDRDDRRTARAHSPEVLAAVSDAYGREILRALRERPATARDLTGRCSASRSTVYRRLDRLEEAGLVESRRTLDPADGHHRLQYRVAVDRIVVEFDDAGVTVRPVARDRTDDPP